MNLLSYNKPTKASSSYPSYEPDKASDENIKTSWSAATGKKDEWLQMDLGQIMKISALQICFADEGFQSYRHDVNTPVYQYIVEYSTDGNQWEMLTDRSKTLKIKFMNLSH